MSDAVYIASRFPIRTAVIQGVHQLWNAMRLEGPRLYVVEAAKLNMSAIEGQSRDLTFKRIIVGHSEQREQPTGLREASKVVLLVYGKFYGGK
jgi:hypothetical protein